MKQRLAPFLVLLEARYVPLLFAVAPQAYAVYLWLFPHPYDKTGELFAVLGAIGYEAVYVGAIAWAEEERASFWTWATAVVALVFSVLVAVYVYLPQGWWSALHAGFPLVAFCYTLNMYSKRSVSTQPATAQTPLETLPERSSSSEPIEVGNDVADVPSASEQAILEELFNLPLEALKPTTSEPSAPLATAQPIEEEPSDAKRVLEIPVFDRLEDLQQDLVRRMAEAEHPGVPLEQVAVVESLRYLCPHCQAVLKSKQALGAAVKNGYCLECKAERLAAA